MDQALLVLSPISAIAALSCSQAASGSRRRLTATARHQFRLVKIS
jgi:hypothetical protein